MPVVEDQGCECTSIFVRQSVLPTPQMRIAGIACLLLATTAAPPPRAPVPINAPRPMIPGT
eukprot:350893-Lingulodinium_polyedra.AAC.1